MSTTALIRESTGSPRTLGEAYLAAERGPRQYVVGERKADERQSLPPWRFYRNVIRCGLYLAERAHLRAGDRVVSLTPLCSERLIFEWAVLAQGGVSVALDPGIPRAELASALRALAPRVALVAGPDELAKLQSVAGGAGIETLLVLDRSVDGPLAWVAAMELGGTLDTAERAQLFRARAGALDPAMPALGLSVGERSSPAAAWRNMSHGEVASGVREVRARIPPGVGDVAYVLGDATSLATRLALLSFVADGMTGTFVGTVGRELTEIEELRPQVLIAPEEVIHRFGKRVRARHPRRALSGWWRRAEHAEPPLKAIMTTDGNRVDAAKNEPTNGR